MFKIEKGIEIPQEPRGRRAKYPFLQMQVGDSFFSEIKAAQRAASQHGKRHGSKFMSRTEGDGVRVWRIE